MAGSNPAQSNSVATSSISTFVDLNYSIFYAEFVFSAKLYAHEVRVWVSLVNLANSSKDINRQVYSLGKDA